MKKKLLSFLGSASLILISNLSIAQLNVGVTSVTKATTTVNTAGVNNAVNATANASKAAANSAITTTKNVSSKAVTKVNNAKPEVKANVDIQTETGVSSASNNSANQSNGNVNSENGSTISVSGKSDVKGEVDSKKTTDAADDTKTKVKENADRTKIKVKNITEKVKEKVRKQNAGLEVSTDAKVQGEVKRQKQ